MLRPTQFPSPVSMVSPGQVFQNGHEGIVLCCHSRSEIDKNITLSQAEYINRTKGKQLSIKSRELPERIRNLIETVKKSWEMATEGIEKAVRPLELRTTRFN